MKCLIIAAGRGIRLWRKAKCKPLVPILGVPLIERVIRSAIEAQIDDFYVVTGYQGELVRSFLDELAQRCRIHITHIVNDEWERGNGVSVLKAREHLDGPFFLLMSDHLFDPSILRDLAEDPPKDGEIVLAVDSNIRNGLVDMADVTRVWAKDGRVRDIGKGLREFNAFDTGIFFCGSAIFKALEQVYREGGNIALSSAVRALAAEGRVRAFDIERRFWLDIDEPRDVDKAERLLLNRLKGKPNDGPVSRYLNRPISIRISRLLTRMPVAPNQITGAVFFLSLIAAGLFALGGYATLVGGGVIAQLASILDGCDGEIARLKYSRSDYGGWLDAVLDRYADAFLLLGLTWHASHGGADGRALIVGFLAIIGSFMLSYTADKYDSLMRDRFSSGRSLRLGRDIRVFIIFIGTLFNQPFLVLLILAVLMNAETVRRIMVCREYA